jgi:cupin fold WbuC family metalloprotein
MLEKILHKKKLFALIVRKSFRKMNGINFFTDKKDTQQFGFIKHKKNHIIKPHQHKKRLTKISITTEVIIILKGCLRVDFYDMKKRYLFSKKIYANEIIMLVNGSHGFKVIKNVEMIEVKQGPYNITKDKIKFNEIEEKKIRLK